MRTRHRRKRLNAMDYAVGMVNSNVVAKLPIHAILSGGIMGMNMRRRRERLNAILNGGILGMRRTRSRLQVIHGGNAWKPCPVD